MTEKECRNDNHYKLLMSAQVKQSKTQNDTKCCLRKEMDIRMEDFPYGIHACFLLHNFCELH